MLRGGFLKSSTEESFIFILYPTDRRIETDSLQLTAYRLPPPPLFVEKEDCYSLLLA